MNPEKSLQDLFNAALERQDAAGRVRFLDEACGADAALRERVEKLLRAADEIGGFMAQPSPKPAGIDSDPTRRVDIPLTEKPGDMIGRYKLLQQIGEGGCGVVYMAEQEEPVRRRVALKVIKLGMDTKQVIARFGAERQALALMDHPNIAKVLDAGATDTGRPYFVMELVRGIRITDYCDQHDLTTVHRLALFTQVCHAIQHAHQKGIIHRDIKPSNILVTSQDGVPVPKVIDFGIAKATTDQPLTDKTVFTAFEQFIGTPAYMSPEQAEMSALDIDTRSDIYSLGVLLYELLTGKTPFDARELLAAGLNEMRRTIREQEPEKPSTRLGTLAGADLTTVAKHRHTEPLKLVDQVRGDLDWIVMKCLEKDRAQRYETANGLAEDIRRHLENEPVVARPPSRLYEFQKTVRRHKFGFAAAGAVIVALAIGMGISTWQFVQKNRAYTRIAAAEREQSRQRQIAEAKEKQSEQVAQFLKDMLASVSPSVAMGRDATMLREVLDRTAERVGKDLEEQPEVEAELRHTMAEVYLAIAEFAKAEQNHREALTLRQRRFGDESLELAASLDGLARTLLAPVLRINFEAMTERDAKNLKEAENLARQAVAIRMSLLGTNHLEAAQSLDTLGGVVDQQRRFAQAEEILREALAIKERLLGKEHLSIADSLSELVRVFNHESKLVEAESAARQSLTMRKKLLGEGHPLTLKSATALARVLQAMSGYDPRFKVPTGVDVSRSAVNARLAEAEILNRQVLAMQRRILPPDHPEVTTTLAKLANVLQYQNKIDEAEGFYREALERRQKQFGPNHPQSKLARRALEEIYQIRASTKDEIALRASLASVREALGDEHEEAALSMYKLARLLLTQGKLVEAEHLCREALVIQRKLLGPSNRSENESLESLAVILKRQGTEGEVEALYREELALRRKTLGDDHTRTLEALDLLLRAVLRTQGIPAAVALLKEELDHARAADGKGWASTNSGVGVLLHHFAEELWNQKAFKEARPPAEQAWTLFEQHPDWPENERMHAFQVLHEVLTSLNDQPALELLHRQVLERLRRKPPAEDLAIAAHLKHLAAHLMAQQKFTEADATHRQVLTIRQDLALKAGENSDATALGNAAWFLASCEEAAFRNGPRAVELAEKAALATGRTNSMILVTLAAAYAETSEFAKAVSVQKEALGLLTDTNQMAALSSRLELYLAKRPYRELNFRIEVANWLAMEVLGLLGRGMAAEAEMSARACLAIREQMLPDDWRTFNSRSQLGGSLLGQKQYAEAEPLLLSGFEGMRQREESIPAAAKDRLKETVERLVQLYEATDKSVKAAEWNKKLAEFKQPEAKK